MPELWLPSGGVNRKQKQLWLPDGGVNRKQKELWAGSGGVNRKIFSGGIEYTVTPYGSSNSKFHWSSNINSNGSGEISGTYYGTSSFQTFDVGFEIEFSESVMFSQDRTQITIEGGITSSTMPGAFFILGSSMGEDQSTRITSSLSKYSITYGRGTSSINKIKIYARGDSYSSSRDFLRFGINPSGIKISGVPLLGMSGTLDLPKTGG